MFFIFLFFLFFFCSVFLEKCVSSCFFNFSLVAFLSSLTKDVSSVVGAPWEMWCLHDIGRDSWDWVGPPAWGRACFNSPEWGGGSSPVKKRSLSRLYYCYCCYFSSFFVFSFFQCFSLFFSCFPFFIFLFFIFHFFHFVLFLYFFIFPRLQKTSLRQLATSSLLAQLDVQQRSSNHQNRFQHCSSDTSMGRE